VCTGIENASSRKSFIESSSLRILRKRCIPTQYNNHHHGRTRPRASEDCWIAPTSPDITQQYYYRRRICNDFSGRERKHQRRRPRYNDHDAVASVDRGMRSIDTYTRTPFLFPPLILSVNTIQIHGILLLLLLYEKVRTYVRPAHDDKCVFGRSSDSNRNR
jgi:hypothetical protein